MVDRLDKLRPQESWKIQETGSSKKDKRNQSDEEKQQNAKSSFEEKVDYSKLISREKTGGSHLFTRDIKHISLKHSPSEAEEEKNYSGIKVETNKASTNKFYRNKTELVLLITAACLVLILMLLIIRLFILI